MRQSSFALARHGLWLRISPHLAYPIGAQTQSSAWMPSFSLRIGLPPCASGAAAPRWRAATRSPPPRADIRSQPPYVSDSAPLLEAAGLELEWREERPRSAEQLERMYALGSSTSTRSATRSALTLEPHDLRPKLARSGRPLESRRSLFIVARRLR